MLLLLLSFTWLKGQIWEQTIYTYIMQDDSLNLMYFHQKNENNILYNALMDIIDRDTSIQLYDGMDPYLNKRITIQDAKQISQYTLAFNTEYNDTIVKVNYTNEDITAYRFVEVLSISKEGRIKRQIQAICPVVNSLDEWGEVRGQIPLFYIDYKSIEEQLAKIQIQSTYLNERYDLKWLLNSAYYEAYLYLSDDLIPQRLPEDKQPIARYYINAILNQKRSQIWDY